MTIMNGVSTIEKYTEPEVQGRISTELIPPVSVENEEEKKVATTPQDIMEVPSQVENITTASHTENPFVPSVGYEVKRFDDSAAIEALINKIKNLPIDD